jgi:hypothetical protein
MAYAPNSFGQKVLNKNRVHVEETSSNNSLDEKTYRNNLQEELEGTYQFQIKKETYAPLISISTLERIKNSRLENEDNVIALDTYIDIFIPSQNKVESSEFKPLEQSLYIIK